MRSVIIFTNPWIGIGGAENTVCCMAEALSAFGTVDVIHGKEDFSDIGMLEEALRGLNEAHPADQSVAAERNLGAGA